MPSGLLWATCNVGAETETDYGLYFQWGDVSGYTAEQVGNGTGKKQFSWGTYKYCSGAGTSNSAMTKYNSSDGLTVLEPEDDAAHVFMGGDWRMPTSGETRELLNNCTWTRSQANGLSGYTVSNKSDSSRYIFLPVGGVADGSSIAYSSESCYYLTSSVEMISYSWSKTFCATYWGNVSDGGHITLGYNSRYRGCCIRAVLNPTS